MFANVSAKNYASFPFSASVVCVHTFIYTEVQMQCHLQNVLFSCFHDSLSNEKARGVEWHQSVLVAALGSPLQEGL